MTAPKPLRGSNQCCPKCGCTVVNSSATLSRGGYGPGLSACANCKTLWEYFTPDQLYDLSSPLCSFKEPCNNCAFRKGSPEQSNRATWAGIKESAKGFEAFYCHKGVPISATAEHGFAYPMRKVRMVVDGKTVTTKVPDKRRLRICRGWLNMAFANKTKQAKEAC